MNKKTLLIVCVVFAVVLIGATLLYNGLADRVETGGLATQPPAATEAPDPSETMENTEPAEATEEPDRAAPDFTVLDKDGNEVKLSDFEGKPVILNFWASWCGPCKSEMPELEAAYQEYGEEIHFLMINCTDGSRETIEIASDFITESGYTFPVYFDTTFEASYTYGASSIPLTYFIDANGDLVAYYMGAMDASILQQGIDMIYMPTVEK